jgi:hypothetical protein
MDHLTHSTLLWVVVGSAVVAVFLWLAMLSSTVGRERDGEIDRLFAPALPAGPIAGEAARARSLDTVASSADRFRALGDPEYGLFLEDAQSESASSAA